MALLITLKVSIAVLIMAIGMGSHPSHALYLWRRPGKLLRAVLAMYVLVPLAAYLLVRFLNADPAAKATLLVLAVSAGAPLLPRKLSRLESDAYVYSLVLTSTLLAIVIVPALVDLLSRRFGVTTELHIAASIAKAFLLPLAVGTIFRLILPNPFCDRASDILSKVGGATLVIAAVGLAVTHWSLFSGLRMEGVTALAAMMLISLAIGHALGGPEPDERTALAVSCATRHVGIAIIVASAFQGPKVSTVIAVYVIASALVSIPYLKLRARRPTSQEG